MLTGKRFMTLAVVLGLCVLATAGCRRKSSKGTTINNQTSSIFTTDSFPGEPVQAGNVADDQRALSESGLDVDSQGDIRVFFNGDRDIAMVVYTTGNDGFSGGGTGAYIHYYDGTFRPGVPLTSAVDLTSAGNNYSSFFGSNAMSTGDVTVAWINTEDSSSSAAGDRNGDAIINWVGADQQDGGADGINEGLFSTYFCVNFADDENHVTAAGTEYRRGFDKFARRVDSEDESGEDIQSFGLISDGLCGEARWDASDSRYSWGDQTTHIIVFWNQFVNNSAAFDPTTLWARYPLDQATPEEDPIVPTSPLEIAILTGGASDSGSDSHETLCDRQYITYNFTIFQRVAADDTASPDFSIANDDDDVFICTSTFNAAGTDFFTPDTIHTSLPDATDNDENDARFISQGGYFVGGHSTFGPDEGILEIVQLHTQLEEEVTGSYSGTASNSGDLVLSQIDPATGQDIGDAFLDLEQTLIFNDRVDETTVEVVMGRNGDYLFIAWLEVVDSGASDEVGLWASHYRTSRDSDFPIAAIGTVVTTPVNVNVDIDGDPVNYFQFQSQLGYICGLQSDAEVMNLFFEQSDGGYDEVDVVRLTADLSTGSASFTAGPDTVVANDDDNGELSSGDFEAVDSGEGGNFFCAFDRDIDSAGIFTDIQLFALRTGVGATSARIDSNLNFRGADLDFLLATPGRDEIGTFGVDDDDQRSAPAEIIHVFFGEDEVSENNNNGTFCLRTRAFYTDDGSATSFSDSFVPDLLEYPFQLSLTQNDDSGFGDPSIDDVTVSGNDLCLLFEQFGHLYYQHFGAGDNGSDADVSWLTTDDNSDGNNDDVYTAPQMVDDDSPVEIDFVEGWWTRGCVCDTCNGAMVFWMKDLEGGGSTNGRYQVRVLASE